MAIGSVNNAVVSGTLPWSLSTSFTETREWPILISDYPDGSSQRQTLANTSRKRYQQSKRLTGTAMNTLRSFYLSHIGAAFKVYKKKADYDAANNNFLVMRFE